MALNASALASELENGIRNVMELGDAEYPKLTQYCQTLATVFVNHFKNNVELNDAKFSGTYPGTVTGLTSSTTITNQQVTGGIK